MTSSTKEQQLMDSFIAHPLNWLSLPLETILDYYHHVNCRRTSDVCYVAHSAVAAIHQRELVMRFPRRMTSQYPQMSSSTSTLRLSHKRRYDSTLRVRPLSKPPYLERRRCTSYACAYICPRVTCGIDVRRMQCMVLG